MGLLLAPIKCRVRRIKFVTRGGFVSDWMRRAEMCQLTAAQLLCAAVRTENKIVSASVIIGLEVLRKGVSCLMAPSKAVRTVVQQFCP